MIILPYLMTLLMLMTSTSLFMIWLLMELNMITFIMLMESENQKFCSQKSLFYFMIQSAASMMIISSCFLETSMCSSISSEMITIGLMTKMGMFPFQTWMFSIANYMSALNLSILLTIQKIPYLSILSMTAMPQTWLLIILSMLAGSIMIMKSYSMKEMLISSSVYSTLWMIVMIQINIKIFIEIYIMYSIAVSSLLYMEEKTQKMEEMMSKIWFTLSMMFLIALPPTNFMLAKIFSTFLIVSNTNMMVTTLIWLATFLSTMGYLKMILTKNWMQKKFLYSKSSSELKLSTKFLTLSLMISTLILMF